MQPYDFIPPPTNKNDNKKHTQKCLNIFNPLSQLTCESKDSYLTKCLINPDLDKLFPRDTEKSTRYSFCQLQESLLNECCSQQYTHK